MCKHTPPPPAAPCAAKKHLLVIRQIQTSNSLVSVFTRPQQYNLAYQNFVQVFAVSKYRQSNFEVKTTTILRTGSLVPDITRVPPVREEPMYRANQTNYKSPFTSRGICSHSFVEEA